MKILLSYSRVHFNPNLSPSEHSFWNSSAAILARSLYYTLLELGEVTYIDQNEKETVAGQSFDLFIGILGTFTDIIKVCQIQKSILFAVNMHPLEQNQLVAKRNEFGILEQALDLTPLVNRNNTLAEAIDCADYILGVGNVLTLNSYLKFGVPLTKIKLLNYGFDEKASSWLENKQSDVVASQVRYFYSASDIGLRKGFDIVEDLLKRVDLTREFFIDIVGKPLDTYYENKLEQLSAQYTDKVKFHGWIDSADQAYKILLSQSDYILAPSLEEGQVGAVVEALRYGVIPLITAQTGLDYAPFGYFEPNLNSNLNLKIFNESLKLSLQDRNILKSRTFEYYQLFHSRYLDVIQDSLKECIYENSMYPKVSILLYLSESTTKLKNLLEKIDQALPYYHNVKLHIISDHPLSSIKPIAQKVLGKRKNNLIIYHKQLECVEQQTLQEMGKYVLVLQDSHFLNNEQLLFEAVMLLEKVPTAAIVGCLQGFYDSQANPIDLNLNTPIGYKVDFCLGSPFIVKKAFLLELNKPILLDEQLLCEEAKSKGYSIFYMPDSENFGQRIEPYSNTQSLQEKSLNGLWFHRNPLHILTVEEQNPTFSVKLTNLVGGFLKSLTVSSSRVS